MAATMELPLHASGPLLRVKEEAGNQVGVEFETTAL